MQSRTRDTEINTVFLTKHQPEIIEVKALGSILFLISLTCGGLTAQESKLVDGARAILSRAMGNPSLENLNSVGEQISSLAKYSDKNDLAAESLRRELIDGLISIPGHAQLFADEIRREQAEVANIVRRGPYGKRIPYNDRRARYLLYILPLLPSPECIKALGSFLNDEMDTPSEPSPSQDWQDLPANCYLSAQGLVKIGLRDSPQKTAYTESPVDLKLWREWYDEVKSGRKTFSFKGQSVEYRFKPDGTWDTLAIANPPDDAVKPPKPVPKPATEKAPNQAMQPAKADDSHHGLVWLWIPALLLMVGAWRFFRRRGAA